MNRDVSKIIRDRVEHDGNRYYAADNISEFIEDGELELLIDEVAGKFEGVLQYDQLIVVRSDIKSMCSHHHQPVSGVCYIACMPGDRVIGLSKYTRIAQHLSQRGHLQEELTEMIAAQIEELTASKAVGVYIRARHGCCENRGIMSSNSSTQTTVLKGEIKTNPALKNEFMHNVQIQENLGVS